MPIASYRIELFGAVRVITGERVVTHFETRKTAALLAYLAYHRHGNHPREVLIEVLWPEEDPEATRARLRQALAALRRAIDPRGAPDPPLAPEGAATTSPLLISDRADVRLDTSVVTTDVLEFESHLRRARQSSEPTERACLLARAVDLYRGELLPGYYEDWIIPERERLAEAHLEGLCRLAATLAESGDLAQAVERARVAVAADPLREESHSQLMRVYSAAGRPADALRQYRELERLLKQHLDAEPSAGAKALARQIADPSPSSPPAASSPSAPADSCAAGRERAPPEVSNAGPHGGRRGPELEPVGGAVPLHSAFYLTRPADAAFASALARGDSIVLVKGPRQVGKTSLLARGLQKARQAGACVVLTDLQKLTEAQLESGDTLFFALAEMIADELQMGGAVEAGWNVRRGWNVNFERFLRRQVFPTLGAPLLWGLDETDRLFGRVFGSEVFGLFRSWHNERSLNPSAPWRQLTLAIAYATEAHLFISDLNQSPFNVGTRLTLDDFTLEQVAELNRRHGGPLRDAAELARFYELLGGNPYLVRRGLHEMTAERLALPAFEAQVDQEQGVFHDHLRRILAALTRDAGLTEAMTEVLRCGRCPTEESFYRLRSAGLLTGDAPLLTLPRCRLYRTFLERRLI